MESSSSAELFRIPRKPVASATHTTKETATFLPQKGNDLLQSSNDSRREIEDDWSHTAWTPSLTRRRTICAFLVLHILLLLGVTIVAVYSTLNQGLATPEANLRYLWIYGPTAGITLFAAPWNRVDYRFRQMAPWVAMPSMVPQPASRRILLDYISPIRPSIIWQSIKCRHWIIFYSSLVTLLNTLVIVFSTGLFALDATTLRLDSVLYTTHTKINDTWEMNNDPTTKADFTSVAVYVLGLDYPLGTTSRFAYQQFNNLGLPPDAIMLAEVDVLDINLECEAAQSVVDHFSFSWRWEASVSPCSYACPYVAGKAVSSPQMNSSIRYRSENCGFNVSSIRLLYDDMSSGETKWWAQMGTSQCNGSLDYSEDARLTLGIGQVRLTESVGPRLYGCPEDAPLANVDFLQSQQWTCKPNVAISKANITYYATTLLSGAVPEIDVDGSAERRPLKGMDKRLYLFWPQLGVSFNESSGPVFEDPRPLPGGVRLASPRLINNHIQLALRGDPELTADELLNTGVFIRMLKGIIESTTYREQPLPTEWFRTTLSSWGQP